MIIKQLEAKIIKNSRNEETIQIIINKKYKASTPSGASTGAHEVKAFPRQGIKKVISFINRHKALWIGEEFKTFNDLEDFEELIQDLGGNTVIALQLAVLKTMSNNKIYSFLNPKAKKLPTPLGNCIGGGAHSKLKSTDIQEFLLIPTAQTFEEKVKINKHIHKLLRKKLKSKKLNDEGAIIPNLSSEETLDFLYNFLEDKDNTLGYKVSIGLDVAASEFYKKTYNYKNFSKENKRLKLKRSEQISLMNEWVQTYKIKYLEDPLEQEDFKGFAKINKKTLVCGDDLTTTNFERLKTALRHNSINAIIIKPNQIGSLNKTKKVVDLAHKNKIKTIISHRSGETMDNSIAHLAVAWKIPYIKTGIYGKEREAKLKELIKIEKELKST